ncbi:MAG TPA: helix-turn-helix transcriptional regulator [Candidatus Saccharimonadales bacterium]|nr:helix-turn-helix transcriptional regulator [Candidatus Saccharimonadales bacterium]
MPKTKASKIFREARRNAGLTQAELAKKAGLSTSGYTKIEQGISRPEPESIKKLVKALDIHQSKVIDLLG